MVNCLVSDLVIRLRNGYMARKTEILVLKSKLVSAILSTLQEEGYIEGFEESGTPHKLVVKLKYVKGKTPALSKIRRISKPGCRRYISLKRPQTWIKKINNFEEFIISTPQGVRVLTGAQTGGEILMGVL